MKLTRHFFISSDLDDLERLEEDLERAGIVTPQIHVLTLDETAADNHHHLHQVTSLMRQDMVHSAIVGALVGLAVSILILLVAYLAGWHNTPAGWVPFIFLAVIALGFFTWEGSFLGFQLPNVHFKRFEKALQEDKHVFFVDLEPKQAKILEDCLPNHPTVQSAGTGPAAPSWIVRWQYRLKYFFTEVFP